MSDIGKTVAHFLAKHQRWIDSKNLGYYRTEYTCECGGTYWAGEHPEDPAYEDARAAHQADMLAPVIRAAKAEAWTQGRESFASDFARPLGLNGMRESSPNPHEVAP